MNIINLRLTSFKAKLVSLMIGVTFVSLLAASVGLAIVQVKNFRHSLEASTLSNMAILSFNLVPMLVFDDSDSANRLLSSLKTRPHVKTAEAYRIDEAGEILLVSRYPERAGSNQASSVGDFDVRDYIEPRFVGEQYYLTYPITLEEEVIGYLYIYSEFSELGDFQLQMIGIVAVIMAICLMLALLIALKSQAVLLRPLSSLVGVTEKISLDKDYTLRVERVGTDEFSHLAMSFNHMLDEIEKHDSQQRLAKAEIRRLNLNLENTVKKRTAALEQANDSLRSTLDQLNRSQNQMVEQEKMASLGGLVAGIAHEINTPVGIGVTAVSHMGELIGQLEEMHQNKTLRPKDLERFLQNVSECVDITCNNLEKAADLVKSFKQVAVDQSSDNIRMLHVEEYLHEILMSLRPKLKTVSHEVSLQCDKALVVRCNAGALSQIITNFIMNSLIHGFDGIDKGEIEISVKRQDQRIFLVYKDNGVGMDAGSLEHIFEPFFTSSRAKGGSGLGAHVVYNLVTQALGGRISAQSVPGEGLTFEIDFPEAEDVQ